MRKHTLVIVLAVFAALFAYAARCRAVAGADGVDHGYIPHIGAVSTPHGPVVMSSYGLALVDPAAEPILALHVRATVLNTSKLPWSVDVTSASLAVADGGPIHPLAVNADPATLPIVVVGAGEHRTLDFFFATPAGVFDDEDIRTFTFGWLGARTTFTRVEVGEDLGVDATAGRHYHWWFDPGYAWPFFNHVDGIVTRRSPTLASVAWLHAEQDELDDVR